MFRDDGTMEMWRDECGIVVLGWRWVAPCVFFAKFGSSCDVRAKALRMIAALLSGMHEDIMADVETLLTTFDAIPVTIGNRACDTDNDGAASHISTLLRAPRDSTSTRNENIDKHMFFENS